jgi:pyruvate dehydrogenase E1 component
MIPLYIFYSMFGFQRTGDAFWAASDQLARGFVLGATAGRTTLNGEGLQHQDGHSPLLAYTNPAVVGYDPAFAFEVAHLVKDGLRRMYGESPENVYYYLTVYNEPILQPAQPADLDLEGVLRGIYRYAPGAGDGARAQLLASGVAVPWALKAQHLLADEWGVAADVWSVTSWTELRRDADRVEEHNLMHPEADPKTPFITDRLTGAAGPVVAVSDYMRAVPDLIARWVPTDFTSLGTDGFGHSDTRGALRRHYHVDAESIAVTALRQLARRGEVPVDLPRQAFKKYQLDDVNAAPQAEAGGDS